MVLIHVVQGRSGNSINQPPPVSRKFGGCFIGPTRRGTKSWARRYRRIICIIRGLGSHPALRRRLHQKNMLLARCVKEMQSPVFECQTMAGVVKNSIAPRSVCCARLPTTPFVNKVAPLPRIRGRELTFSVLEV